MAARFRIPGLLGLIFFGMLFGPHVLGWLGRIGLVQDLGQIGILYLMFLAGLSFNIRAFLDNRMSAITFGLLGFFVPFALSIWVSTDILEMEFIAAAMVGAMWASNTLVAYPEVRAAGLADTRAVRDAVSAGVVADLLSLLVLAVATSDAAIESLPVPPATVLPEQPPTLPLLIAIPLLIGVTLWILPRFGSWFFVRVGHSRVQRFLFALLGMAIGAAVAVMGGVEGIIGAFLAGLGLNRLVPANSELMDRLDFVGSSIFIPAFLVSIGLNIDPAALFDFSTLGLGLLFAALVIVGKTIASGIGAGIFRLSFAEGGLMASLSFGQAASTLAIAQVGASLGLFGQEVVNGAILAIVLTALATSVLTQWFIRRAPRAESAPAAIGERVLVDSRPSKSNLTTVMEFSGLIAAADGGILIPFTVPDSPRLESARTRIDEAVRAAALAGHDTDGVVRVSESFTTGALELSQEAEATLTVLTWSGPRLGSSYFFGDEIDAFGERSSRPTIAVRMLAPWTRVVLLVGQTGAEWHVEDARLAAQIAVRTRRSKEDALLVVAPDPGMVADELAGVEPVELIHGDLRRSSAILSMIEPNDLLILPAYVLNELAMTDRMRFVRSMERIDLAIVAGPNRLAVSRTKPPHRTERLIGHG